ncbi:MAG: hypothetical protein AAFR49_09680 [Pseudomonadota bacterium]
MALILTGSSTTGFTATTNFDTYVTREFETISSSGDGFDFGLATGNEYVLLGDIIAGSDGIKSSISSTGANTVVIQNGASVFGRSDGVELSGNDNRDQQRVCSWR